MRRTDPVRREGVHRFTRGMLFKIRSIRCETEDDRIEGGVEIKGSPVGVDARTQSIPAYFIQLHPARHPAYAVTGRVPAYISIT